MPAGRVVSCLRVRCMRSWRPFCWGWPFDGDAEPQPPDGELGEIEQAVRTGERDAIVGTDRRRQAALLEELLEGGDGGVFPRRFQRLTKQKIARGVVGDGEGITNSARRRA